MSSLHTGTCLCSARGDSEACPSMETKPLALLGGNPPQLPCCPLLPHPSHYRISPGIRVKKALLLFLLQLTLWAEDRKQSPEDF